MSYNIFQSDYDKQRKIDNVKITDMQYNVLQSMLYDGQKSEQGCDANGFPIINITDKNSWFANNVAFIFGKGAIYDEDDDKILHTILSAFTNEIHGQSFLINQFMIEDYKTSDLLKNLEKQLYIKNGNYHICLIPLVMFDADITKAPEDIYRKHGIVNKYMQWSTIESYISSCIAAYGLRTDPVNQPKEELHPILGSAERFNFDAEMDIDKMTKNIEQYIKKSELDKIQRFPINYGGRDGVNTSQTNIKGRKKENLWNQIKADQVATTTIPTGIAGAVSRYDMNYMYNIESRKNPEYTEYQVYNDDNTYDKNTGKNIVTPGAYSTAMPKFNMLKTGKNKIKHNY